MRDRRTLVRIGAVCLLVALLLVLLFTGGGGPAATVKDFAGAWQDGDYAEACDRLGADARRSVATVTIGTADPRTLMDVPDLESDEDAACAFFLEHLATEYEQDIAATVNGEVVDEDEESDRATAEIDGVGGFVLSESGGDWIIQEIPFIPLAGGQAL